MWYYDNYIYHKRVNMTKIDISIQDLKTGELYYEKQENQYVFNYNSTKFPLSLIMPYKASSYIWKNKLHPIFDMYMPEGYLFEIFKNFLSKKYAYLDDFLIFSYLCSNIQSRIQFRSELNTKNNEVLDINYVLENDSKDMFSKLVETFLERNSISGIQPKTLALLEDKEAFSCKEYIIKTWGDEYPELSLNEYFCLKAVENAGVKIPNITLSKNNNYLLVERFNIDKKDGGFLGFEEVLGLLGKNKEEKYASSYEQVAKVIYSVVTNKKEDMIFLFKTIVMSYLLKNGDAHLKNFGVVYDNNFKNISFSPAYDIVNTVVYFNKDRPALTMFGKKLWFGKKELMKFGVNSCYLSTKDSECFYDECLQSLKNSIKTVEKYITKNKKFEDIGSKMIDTWKESLKEKTQKELSDEIIRNWTKDKKTKT